ncbi:hypothetical protein KR059_012780, partial [Drosophila kikkawai]
IMADLRGVKHFDRKFVASNLKNLLHCPKCSKNYTNSQGEQNHRPFLLPCGHSLCENCLSKDLQHLTCAVCQEPAPPLINAKNLAASSFRVRVCDFYELNYHVLGEASSLISFRSLDTEPVNETLTHSLANEVISQATLCSECRNDDAMGECLECNAFYCSICFGGIHKHSRVLQTHKFQKLRDGPLKGFFIGNQMFNMPVQRECHLHSLPMNVFCFNCKRCHCAKCSSVHHNSHKTQPLYQKNQRLQSEIPSTLQSLKLALMNIQNGQEVVRAAKQKLSDYASETLASISKHFCHLHGLLQVAELQIVEKLRESSLPPQMELNEAMGQLNGYEELIKHLMQYLDNGVPKNIWLKELIQQSTKHLKRIPSTVQVSHIKMNPYHIYSEHIDILNIIDKKFNCTFVNPNIKVSFKTDFERERSICSINNADNTFSMSFSSDKENTCRSNSQGPGQQNQHQLLSQKSNINSMSTSQKNHAKKSTKSSLNSTAATIDSFQPRNHHQQQDFVRNFSTMDITKPATGMAEKADWFKTDAVVNIRSIKSPEDFYVQDTNAAQRVRNEIDTFAQSLTGILAPPDIEVGQHYIIYVKDQHRYYRAMVTQKMATQDTCKVFFPDTGVFHEMHTSQFREMPERLSHLPYSAMHCSLELMPTSDADSEWGPKAITFLKQIVKNNPVRLIVKKALSHDLHEVDLISSNYNTSISVRDSFLYSGLARSRCGRLKSLQQSAPSKLRLTRPKLQFGDIFMIQMMHVEHPQEFYVMRHDLESERCQMQSSLQRHMNRLSLNKLESIFLGCLHLGCVLQLDGLWKRASIEQLLPDGYVVVRLVDDGPTQTVYWDELFVLPAEFWEPERTIRCSLADVETLQDLSYVWTPEATAFFKQLTSNPKLYIEVINFTEDVVYVALKFTRGTSETTNVAVQMVAQRHCTSTGESSRMFTNAQASQRSARLDDDTRRFLDQQKVQAVALTPFRKPEAGTEDRNERSNVKILYIRQPGEFYVTLPHFQSAIERMQQSVQMAAEAMYQNQMLQTDWKVGDLCLVRVQADSDLDTLWHRGVVTQVNSSFRYHIQLRDIGQVVENVPTSSMANADESLMKITSSALRCHLCGIKPVGTEWSTEAIDYFKDQVQAYDQVYTTSQGKTSNSVSVILYGAHTVVSGPFSPAHTIYVNINKELLRKNLAVKNIDDINDTQNSMLFFDSFSSTGTTISNDKEPVQTWLDKIDESRIFTNLIEVPGGRTVRGFEHNEDMPPMELLDDLAKGQKTTGQTVPPPGWSTPRKSDKTIFTAIATNVNYECSIYLTLGSDKPYLEYIRKLLEHHYKPLMNRQQQKNRCYTYGVGQPVLVTYHMDNLLYRGIVQRLPNSHDEYTVYYVDYGNLEKVKADEMLPYAPFPQLNAMCWLVNIHGVRPKGGKYTDKQMDTVHQQLVMKLSSVHVVEPKGVGTSKLPTCNIKVGNVDMATMMIDCGMAIPVEAKNQKNSLKFTLQKKELEAFRVFDELETLGATQQRRLGGQSHHRNETDSSVNQPPVKKMYLLNTKEVNRFEKDQDFDCQQAAQEMGLDNSYDCADSDGCSGELQAADVTIADDEEIELGRDHCLHEMDINIDGEDSSSSDSSSDEMKPLSISAADQLQRRIELRHKDMKENVSFSPMDTSSVRSNFDGSTSFKTLSLPTGVKEFLCTVNNVLSALELQIAPCLSEFTKHEITLIKETSLLIKEAAALTSPKINDLCLARYSKDRRWYRAIVKEIQERIEQATVFYIDFHDTERVSYTNLKEMPNQLFMFPQRSFRVKLHGVKRNQNYEDKKVLQSLRTCLCNYSKVYARVHYPFNYHANNSDHSEVGKFDLIEVELFENRHKKKLAYQSLIDNWMLIPKK